MTDEEEVLHKALKSGLIDFNAMRIEVEKMERQEYLSQHQSAVWKGKDNVYKTWVLDENTQKRRLIRKRTKKELEDFLIKHYKSLQEEPTVAKCFNLWLEEKMRYGEIQEQTYYRYIATYDRFLKNNAISRMKIKNVDSHCLEHFIKASIHDFSLTAKGWADLRLVLYGVFKYAKRNDFTDLSITYFMGDLDLSRNAFKRMKRRDEEQVFSDEEVGKIMAYLKGKIPTILELGVILGFETGLRVGEISSLKYSDLEGDVLYVRRTEVKIKVNGKWTYTVRERTKGREGERKIVLTDKAIHTLQKAHLMNPQTEYLFCKDGKRVTGKQYTRCLYRICDKVNIPHRSMHKARKTYASTLLDAGISPRIVMNQMGHTMIETTEAYYHFNKKQVGEIKEILSKTIVI